MSTLVAYYSRAGHTAEVAKQVQAVSDGDLFEIKGTKNYGSYAKAIVIARREFSNGELPKVVGEVKDFDSYDRILLGFPIWYGKAPQLVISFLKEYDLKGKDIYPFCTSGASGPEAAEKQLAEAFPEATFHPAMRCKTADAGEVEAWLAK